MTNKIDLIDRLFSTHQADLLDTLQDIHPPIMPKFKDRILCPICLVGYQKHELTDGHVWPGSIRARSKAKHPHRVLLCEKCNHTSGSRGDTQMQLLEEIKKEESDGYYRERGTQILLGPGVKPIPLNTAFSTSEKRKDKIKGKFTYASKRNNPSEVKRINDLAFKQRRHFSVAIPPYHSVRPQVAQAGWITGAYLACFRAFGYRYILHYLLNPVRQVILDSFTDDEPKFLESDTFQVRQCNEHDMAEPIVGVIVPLDGNIPVYVQVDFWNYHIRLPVYFSHEVLDIMIDMEEAKGFEIPTEKGATVGMPVDCYKTSDAPNLHMCIWDYFLGKYIRK